MCYSLRELAGYQRSVAGVSKIGTPGKKCLQGLPIAMMYLNTELLVILKALSAVCFGARYPNVILEKPIVSCEPERILIRVRTSESSPSHIYAEDYIDDPDCVSRNLNRLSLPLGKCGMTVEKTKTPIATIFRVCITIQLHPLFVTDNDRSYCAQCVYMETNVIENLQQSLSVSDSTPSNLEPQFDVVTTQPRCSYEIRRNSIDGQPIRYALLGETVYHVWKCYDDNVQILVQNCYVEDGEGNRILIIDGDGCGVDQYILPTPVYSADRRTASQEIHVFKFVEKMITRFTCQIRVCSPQNDSCQALVPPGRCPTVEERAAKMIDRSRPSGAPVVGTPSPVTARTQAPVAVTNTTTATVVTTTTTTATRTAVKTATITTTSRYVPTRKLGPIPPAPRSKPVTVAATTTATEEPFFVSATDEYESYAESNSASPPSIRPPSSSEEGIRVEPSSYQRRTRRNYSKDGPDEGIPEGDLQSLSSSSPDYSSFDVSGVLTVLDSPDDVTYFEGKRPSTGAHHGTAGAGAVGAGSNSSTKCMPQIVFFVILLGVIALAAALISVIVACVTDSGSRKRALISSSHIGDL